MSVELNQATIARSFAETSAHGTAVARVKLWHVMGVALLLRALLPLLSYVHVRNVAIFYAPDSATYIEPAREMVAHQRFYYEETPEIFRTPGYPVLLIPGLLLHRLEAVTIGLQVVLGSVTLFVVYQTALLLFDQKNAALLAASLYAIEPISILYTTQLLTETLFSTLVIGWLYFLLRYITGRSFRCLLICGVLMACSIYVRPVGYFLPLIISVGLLARAVFAPGHDRTRRLAAHAVCFFAVSMGLTVPWQVRNWLETGYSGFSGSPAHIMYFFTAASVLAAQQQVPFYEMQDRMGYRDENIYFERHPEQRAWSVPQRLEYQKREATSIVAHNPLTSARIQLSGVIRLMFDPGGVEFLKLFGVYPKEGGGLLGRLVDKGIFRTVTALMVERPLVFWSSALLLPLELFLILCAFVGVFYRRPVQEDCILVVVLVVIYYVTVSGGPAAVGRYRVPVMPIICMLAGYGAWSIWSGALKSRVVCRSA